MIVRCSSVPLKFTAVYKHPNIYFSMAFSQSFVKMGLPKFPMTRNELFQITQRRLWSNSNSNWSCFTHNHEIGKTWGRASKGRQCILYKIWWWMGQKCLEEIRKGRKESEVTLWEQAGWHSYVLMAAVVLV